MGRSAGATRRWGRTVRRRWCRAGTATRALLRVRSWGWSLPVSAGSLLAGLAVSRRSLTGLSISGLRGLTRLTRLTRLTVPTGSLRTWLTVTTRGLLAIVLVRTA